MSSSAAAKQEGARFETISPILSVESVPTSIEYYVKVLGFSGQVRKIRRVSSRL